MSTVTKDLVLGSGILATCAVLLAVAFTAPSAPPEASEGSELAMRTQQELRNDRPSTPPLGSDIPAPADPTPSQTDTSRAMTWEEVDETDTTDPSDESTEVAQIDPIDSTGPTIIPWGEIEVTPFVDQELRDLATVEREREREHEARARETRQQDAQGSQESPGLASRERRHTVVPGESYQSISSQYYGTTREWRRIQEANQIDQHLLMPGMELRIPALPSTASTQPTPGQDAEPATAAAKSARQYTVQRGDSFYTIARDQLGDARRYQEIQRLNAIDPYDLRVGMIISLPEGSATRTQASTGAASTGSERQELPEGAVIHEVARGEILGDISMRYYGTSRRWRAIADANNITDPSSLRVGQRLVIPDAGERRARVAGSRTGTTAVEEAGRGPGLWHEIQSGDTFQVLSQQYYGTTRRHQDIRSANPDLDPRRLVVGTRVWIPGAEAGRSVEGSQPRQSQPTETRQSTDRPDWGSVSP